MKKILILLIISAIFFGGCEKFLDINKDPDALEDAPLQLLLPSALISPLYVLNSDAQIIGAYWAQHWTQATNAPQYQGYDSWQITNSTFDGRGYGAFYSYSLMDLENIRIKAKAQQNWNYYLIATSVQCYVWQILVDLYDKVPFNEALLGNTGNITPKFDNGDVIYDSLIVRLDDALAKDFSATTSKKPSTDDIIFGGNMDRWKEFTNTLKLKIFLRQSKARPSVCAAGVNSLQGKSFLTQAASTNIFLNQADKRNPMYSIAEIQHKGNITMSRTLMSYLVNDIDDESYSERDPRVNAIAKKPASIPYHRALFQGDYRNGDFAEDHNQLSKPNINFDSPVFYFSLSESYFLQAEADLLYWNSGIAKELYDKALVADFNRLGITDTVELNKVKKGYAEFKNSDNQTKKMELIYMQKWVAMANIQGMEAFFEHNRTNYPGEFTTYRVNDELFENEYKKTENRGKFTISVNNVTSDRFPRRLMCPQSEVNGNPNTPSELKEKKIFDPVWWDVD